MPASNKPNTKVQVLLPESRSNYHLPVNLKEGDLWLFARDVERCLPETCLTELQDVRVSHDGFLFRRGMVLKESFAFDYLFDEWKKRKRRVAKFVAQNYVLNRTRHFESDALWITDDWSVGYFHWLADALSRLSVVRHLLDDTVLLLPHNYQTFSFVKPTLKAFGVRNVEFLAADEVLQCRRVIMPTHVAPSGHYNFEVIKRVRDYLIHAYGDQGEPNQLIYISRSRARRRRILNENEVTELLQTFGFRVIHPEDITFQEQVRLFSQAKYLISNHGAGLTNMLFMKPGSSVLELRHEQDETNNCYFTLASAVALNYYYQTCTPVIPGEDAHTADLVVDTSPLKTNLEQLLSTGLD